MRIAPTLADIPQIKPKGKDRSLSLPTPALFIHWECISKVITAVMILKSVSVWVFVLVLLRPISAEDTVSSGNYLIHLCNSGELGSEASYLQSLLPQVYDGLQKVILDLQRTASEHGYSAFFKDDSNKAEVLQVYQKMAAGANVYVGRLDHVSERRPTFACANDVPKTHLPYQYCKPRTPLMTWVHTEIIFLCPLFWMMAQKTLPSDCPLVVANTLTPNDDRLLQNQEALLVGSLVHLYHDFDSNIIVTITDASELSASQSLINAPNYALYYAGERLLLPMLLK